MRNQRYMISLFLVWSFILLAGRFFGRAGLTEKKTDLMIGVKIYEHKGSLPALFAEWRALGINTALVSPALASQGEFRELARKQGVALFLILPIFYNPEELKKNPDLHAVTDRGEKAKDDWVEFICPTREDYRRRRVEEIRSLVRELDPDGISLDFIRFFVFWEMVYPERALDSIADTCFDESCLTKFQQETGIMVPADLTAIPDKSAWIVKNHRREWTDWKCRIIANLVRSIAEEARKIKPGIMVNVHSVPWRQDDFGGAIKTIAGQDLKAIAPLTDLVSPMCYWHMLKRQSPWIHSVVEDVYSLTKGRVIPSIQVGNAYISAKLSAAEFKEALEQALKPPSRGVIFWNWDAIAQEPDKKAVIQTFSKSVEKN